ncbi:hypothetical protein [Pleionea litopenaei]|uniref:MFS transporter n=1 Tax=Pleionea litopenaei TaxID=3070815 RepID=A0AA51RTL7_9GAMM|nr:hypothetical protein [Pleionea sp. HL-JVS1]WMS87362.1 hypothetical protein Q9312_00180 [Pleionea sp. HL-JVS1]
MLMLGQHKLSDYATISEIINDVSWSGISQLGLLIFASASASLLSSYTWGRLADQSSQSVLTYSGLISSVSLVSLIIISLVFPQLLQNLFVLPLLLFGLMIGYQGIRLGRSIHLVNITDDDNRAHFTAISNTAIGFVLISGSSFGLIAHWMGTLWVVGIFASMCILGTWYSLKLKDSE